VKNWDEFADDSDEEDGDGKVETRPEEKLPAFKLQKPT
jgi:hypothetical protein